jgi:transcriptional regulator
MTPTPIFQDTDRDHALDFIDAHPFALVSVNGAEGPVVALVPLVLNADRTKLLGHIARNNAFWKAAEATDMPASAVFQGGDAYVSPSSYPSKATDPRTVPTWNYMAVEARGAITVEPRAEAMLPYIAELTDAMESHRQVPWKLSDAPAEYIEKLSRGIVGFEITVDALTHVRKLSQNKSESDQRGVRESFDAADPSAQRVAKAMGAGK